jgi:hypothetical protein
MRFMYIQPKSGIMEINPLPVRFLAIYWTHWSEFFLHIFKICSGQGSAAVATKSLGSIKGREFPD